MTQHTLLIWIEFLVILKLTIWEGNMPTKKSSKSETSKPANKKSTKAESAKKSTSSEKKPAEYDESKIKTLGSLEHIRLRSGMYIGRLGDGSNINDGVYVLLKEVIDNSIDEYIMGHGKKIEITVDHTSKCIAVRDYGRGIPLGKVIECVSVINTGAKYNSEVFQFSVGLNGVGTKAVNALSSYFKVSSFREGKYKSAVFKHGKIVEEKQGNTKETAGTYIEFIPDDTIFPPDYSYDMEIIHQRLWNYAHLNTGLILACNKESFVSKNGLADLLKNEVGTGEIYEIHRFQKDNLEFSFTHVHGDNAANFSFVNGQYTSDGGTHLSAFLEGLLRGINEFYSQNYSSSDLREGLLVAVSIKLQEPIFESQTKNKLGNTNIKTWIVQDTRDLVVDYLYKQKDFATKLSEKLEQNRKLRKELQEVRKEAREAAKKVSIKVPNFRDCKIHKDDKDPRKDETMIFITEGHSATGSIIPARNVYTQAIFSLRGKLANVVDGKRTKIYKDSELYNMMVALGIENSTDNLRFSKIIIATDADFDGFHIRNLLITFFLTFFEDLVVNNHLYILETPLFRVRNKKEQHYCYTITERDEIIAQMGGNPEITRFKGLGEISPSEFGNFIGADIKLIPVTIKTLKTIPQTLQFYMGKNTEERKKFMQENLI